MDVFDDVGRQFQYLVAKFGYQALKSIFNAYYIFHSVTVKQLHENGPDNVIDAGAEAATGDNGRLRLCRVKKNLFPGTRHFKRERNTARSNHIFIMFKINIIKNAFAI